MTTINYQQLQGKIGKLIKDLGVSARIEHLLDPTPDGETKKSTCSIVFSSTEQSDMSDPGHPSTLVQELYTAFITHIKLVPQPGDRVYVRKEIYQIRNVDQYKPAGTNIAYKLILNRIGVDE